MLKARGLRAPLLFLWQRLFFVGAAPILRLRVIPSVYSRKADVEPNIMKTTIELPLLPLRDVVAYPHMVIPLFVGREKSIEALEAAMTGEKQILLIAQNNPADDDPGEDGLFRVGTVATVLQLLKLPDGTVKVLVEGEQRGAVERFIEVDGHCRAEVRLIDEVDAPGRESEVFVRSLLSQFEQYVQLGKKVPPEVLSSLNGIDEPSRLVDTMAAHMALKIEQKQEIGR